MNEPKPFASLSPSLLARKGAARPAMRPQLQPLSFHEKNGGGFATVAATASHDDSHEDLGWNDMGEDRPEPHQLETLRPEAASQAPADVVVALAAPTADDKRPSDGPLSDGTVIKPEVLRQLSALAESIAAAPADQPSRNLRSALKEGRRAAFTLRVDAQRHLRLRLACTLQNRSAQLVIIEALDRLLDELPGLDELTRRVKRG
ncbi:hypothetical protein [Novosphingobium lentum]|uniref:hypothetical protein n=1 Tax=Novosphingobium lentum TaxID=145287 RepID=UPI0008367547|nr:hypothetical protein [Novosphingobium lentum]